MGPSKRIWAGIVIAYLYAVGLVILAGMAYLIRDWKYLEIASACPIAILIILCWYVNRIK